MSPLLAGIIGIALLFFLFATGMPIGFVMALVGLLGYIYLGSLDAGLYLLGYSFYSNGTNSPMSINNGITLKV